MYFIKLIIIYLLISINIHAQDLSDKYAVKNKKEAYEKAISWSGLDSTSFTFKKLSESIELIVIKNKNIPFFSDDFLDEKVWEVTISNLILRLNGWDKSYLKNQKTKTYKILIDAKSGKLIRITAQVDTYNTFFYDKSKSEVTERSLLRSGNEYISLPVKTPKVNMLSALEAAVPSSPLMAEEVYLICVLMSELQKEPRLVWIVTGNNIPDNSDNESYIRSVVDANTGKLLHYSNYP